MVDLIPSPNIFSLKNSFKIALFIFILQYSSLSFGLVDKQSLSKKQVTFLNAYDAIKKNNNDLFSIYRKRLNNYNLKPFLDYYNLTYNFKDKSPQQINQFINNKENYLLKSRLVNRYLLFLGANKKHSLFLKYYNAETYPSKKLICYAYHAKLENNANDKKTLKLAQKEWTKQLKISWSCKGMNKYLTSHNKITAKMIWSKTIKNMQKGKIKQAQKLASKLSKQNKKTLTFWINTYKNHDVSLFGAMPNYVPRYIQKYIFMQSINRNGYKTPRKAISLLKKYATKYNLSKTEVQKLKRRISLRLAYKFQPDAETKLADLNKNSTDKTVFNWRLQLAIRNSNWKHYLHLYNLLPKKEKKSKRWLYWKARSLSELNQPKTAKKIFTSLSKTRSYYGFLSADRLNTSYQFNHVKANKYSQNELLKKYPLLRIMNELIAIGWNENLNIVWHQLLKKASPKDIEAIANYLSNKGKHSLAIQTIAKIKKWNDLKLRFPTPYKTFIEKTAQENMITPSWIYGIIRRESAFATKVRSSVGATGLMQLMPATAKSVGDKIGIKNTSKSQLQSPQTNIKLGSAYLNYLYKKYNKNQILATAAYNAGPHRVDKWLPKSRNISADQWIDSIVFTETRNYVKAVLEYSIIYQSFINNQHNRLEKLMFKIGKKKALGTN